MKKKRLKSEYCLVAFFVLVIVLFMVTILLRAFTRNVLVERLGIENTFTEAVFFDYTGENGLRKPVASIDWQNKYPFKSNDETVEQKDDSAINRVDDIAKSIKSWLNVYTTDQLVGYNSFANAANRYEKAIGWNFAAYSEYNGVVTLSDGYLISFTSKKDITESVDSTAEFAQYLDGANIDFMFVVAPTKISNYDDEEISGTLDFANQNADEFIKSQYKANVDILDLRAAIKNEGLNHRELFYVTDHHWKSETGLWAAQQILQSIADNYGYNTDYALLNPDNFNREVYQNILLGSEGRKVTLAKASPEDFALLYPKFNTDLEFSAPDLEMNISGDFSIMYDMSQLEEVDYYNKSPYHTFAYGDRPLLTVKNNNAPNNLKVLFIHDSFGDVVLPFLSLGAEEVDSLDLRQFTGSVQSYIETTKPDAVVVLYNADSIGGTVGVTHTSLFDFR